jgi:hypothetical protein
VVQWEQLQTKYLESLKSKLPVQCQIWITAIIWKLWDVIWDLWEHRNSILHHKETGQLVVHLNHLIEQEFQVGCQELDRIDQALFHQPLPAILQTSITYKERWVQWDQFACAKLTSYRLAGVPPYSEVRRCLFRWLQPLYYIILGIWT